jgi:outer membrane protein assembly factor BamB
MAIAGDYNIVAFDRSTGAVRWRFAPATGYGPGIYLGVAVDGRVFAGSPSGRLYAIDRSTGLLRWTMVVSGDGKTTVFAPVADQQLVVAGFSTFTAPKTGGVIAVDASTGRERWKRYFPIRAGALTSTNVTGGPVFSGSDVIAASGDGTIWAFDRQTGASRWSIRPIRNALSGRATRSGEDFRSLAVSGRTLIAGSVTGTLVAYDLHTRKERWRYDAQQGSIALHIEAAGDTAYVPYFSGRVIAIDIVAGREQWRIEEPDNAFHWPPAIEGDRLFLAGSRALVTTHR